jgi:hypothetical protein
MRMPGFWGLRDDRDVLWNHSLVIRVRILPTTILYTVLALVDNRLKADA